ncbi:hypothetical protein [Dechloromonas sp. ZS-1]|uniref:hypothetical protein n=1 Tax=Dechloromonas sp. ZS-1 TaxID=3138067 RepID=UPI0031FD50EA
MTLTELAQIAQSVSIILAALFAIYGLDAWRREHVGKRRIELAEETLALFYQAKDAIESIRNSFGYEGEGTTRVPGLNENPEHKAALDQAYVLIERYNRHSELFSRIHSLRYRVMAQLGIEAAQPFDALNRIVNELIFSARRMARLHTQRERPYESEEAAERRSREYLEVMSIYYSGAEDDPISPKVQKAVDDIERTCRKIIESKGTLYALINAKLRKRD